MNLTEQSFLKDIENHTTLLRRDQKDGRYFSLGTLDRKVTYAVCGDASNSYLFIRADNTRPEPVWIIGKSWEWWVLRKAYESKNKDPFLPAILDAKERFTQ